MADTNSFDRRTKPATDERTGVIDAVRSPLPTEASSDPLIATVGGGAGGIPRYFGSNMTTEVVLW